MLDRTPGHAGEDRVRRVLNDRDAPQGLDRLQSCGAVVETSGQDHADRVGSRRERRAAEQRIDGRTMPILVRSTDGSNREVFFDEQVGRFEMVRILSTSCRVVELVV